MNENRIRAELLKQIDADSAIALEKVERYVSLTQIFYELKKSVAEDGPVTITVNGSQRFTKTNPAIDAMNKVNSQLIALGKDMGVDVLPAPKDGPEIETAESAML